jgi:tetratricopeptide (TPR) repeat protein
MGLAVLAGSVGWIVRDQAARQAKRVGDIESALKDAEQFRSDGKLPNAQAAAKRAETLLQDGAAAPALAEEVQNLLRELAEEEADSRLVGELAELRLRQAAVDVKKNSFHLERSRPEYQQAFGNYGLHWEMMTPEEAAARLQSRPQSIRATLVAALDHWLILARFEKAPEADWLEQVLAVADPDDWRQRLRAARIQDDRKALEQLAAEVDPVKQPAEALYVLQRALRQRDAKASALALLQRAQQAYPADFWINQALGMILQECQPPQYEEAIRFLTVAAALRPDSPGVHLDLSGVLHAKGRLDEAIAEDREAIRLKKDYAEAHNNLGVVLQDKGQVDEAIAEYREAIRLKKDLALAHCNLGGMLEQKGEFNEALIYWRRGHELGSKNPHWRYPSAEWVRKCERLVELDGKLSAILSGRKQPADTAERLALAHLCVMPCKKRYVASVQLFREAFEEEPKLADDLNAQHRYEAACAAAQAGCGQGQDADKLDTNERARLRRQALDWLRADLKAHQQQVEKSADKAPWVVVRQMQHWLKDEDFAGVRGSAALARLPEAERGEWHKLWQEVEALRQRATERPASARPARP